MRVFRLSSLAFALGCSTLACSSAPDAPVATPERATLATTSEAFTDLPSSVDESALDRTANPCDDFYQFACGGYLKSVTLSGDYDVHSRAFGGENDVDQAALNEVLAAAAANRSNPEDRKVADYYAACTSFNTNRQPGQLADALSGELRAVHDARKHGGFSAVLGRAVRSVAATDSTFNDQGANQPLFRLYAAPDRQRDSDVVALNLAPAYLFETDAPSVAYQVAELFPSFSAADQDSLTQLVVRIDTALSNIGADPFAHDDHPVGRAGLAQAMPHVDWDAFFRQLGIPGAQDIVIWNLDGLVAADGVLGTIRTDDLIRYMDYKIAENWLFIDGYSGESAQDAQKACSRETANALAGIVEHRFTKTVVGKKNVDLIMDMAKAEIATFERTLATAPFLDDATRAEALTKAQAMKVTPLLEPRDRYADVDIDRSAFIRDQLALWGRFTDAQLARVDEKPGKDWSLSHIYFVAEAVYQPDENTFRIFPGIAHGAFFGGKSATPAFDYGALGWVIGHEITHGFDNTGRHYDGNGAYRDWWSASSAGAFDARAACFVDQYASIPIDGVTDPGTGLPAHVDGHYTLGENIADNGGIRTAWETAKPSFANGKLDKGFTPEQQFFLAAGQLRCDVRGPGAVLQGLSYDAHATPKERINVTAQNFEEFAKAFQCKPTDKMVAQPACRVW